MNHHRLTEGIVLAVGRGCWLVLSGWKQGLDIVASLSIAIRIFCKKKKKSNSDYLVMHVVLLVPRLCFLGDKNKKYFARKGQTRMFLIEKKG